LSTSPIVLSGTALPTDGYLTMLHSDQDQTIVLEYLLFSFYVRDDPTGQ